jgi:hypothetical protein
VAAGSRFATLVMTVGNGSQIGSACAGMFVKRAWSSLSQRGAVAVLPLVLTWHCAQATETTVITLSCDGTIRETSANATQEPINKMGLVVNLAEHTVSFAGYVAQIDKVDAANISFTEEENNKLQLAGRGSGTGVAVTGDIDRVTGAVLITQFSTVSTFTYDLLCKPATRLF